MDVNFSQSQLLQFYLYSLLSLLFKGVYLEFSLTYVLILSET